MSCLANVQRSGAGVTMMNFIREKKWMSDGLSVVRGGPDNASEVCAKWRDHKMSQFFHLKLEQAKHPSFAFKVVSRPNRQVMGVATIRSSLLCHEGPLDVRLLELTRGPARHEKRQVVGASLPPQAALVLLCFKIQNQIP